MPKVCTVCASPFRHEIDMQLVQGRISLADVAKRTNVSRQAIMRHKANHIPKQLRSFATRVDALEADQLMAQIMKLYERNLESLDRAESMAADSDFAKAVPALIREARANLETLAKVSVVLADTQTEPTVVTNELATMIHEALERRSLGAGPSKQAASTHGPTAPAEDEDIVDAEVVTDSPVSST